jgi:O-antigen ligase
VLRFPAFPPAISPRLWVGGYVAFATTFLFLDTRSQRNLYYALAILLAWPLWRELRRRSYSRSPVLAVSLAFLFYFWASSIWAVDATALSVLDQTRRLLLLLFFFAATLTISAFEPDLWVPVFRWLGYLAGPLAAFAIIWHLAQGMGSERLVGLGRTNHPIIGATIYGAIVVAVWTGVLPRARGAVDHALLGFGVLGGVLFIALSQSRGAMVAVAAALLVGALLQRRWYTLIAVLAAPAVYLALIVAGWIAPTGLIERGSNNRFEIWSQVLDRIALSPLFGEGVTATFAFPMEHHLEHLPHNIFLAAQLYGGIPGTALLVALFGCGFAAAIRVFRREGETWFVTMLIFAFVCGQFDFRVVPTNVEHEWLYLWLPLVLLGRREMSASAPRTASP